MPAPLYSSVFRLSAPMFLETAWSSARTSWVWPPGVWAAGGIQSVPASTTSAAQMNSVAFFTFSLVVFFTIILVVFLTIVLLATTDATAPARAEGGQRIRESGPPAGVAAPGRAAAWSISSYQPGILPCAPRVTFADGRNFYLGAPDNRRPVMTARRSNQESFALNPVRRQYIRTRRRVTRWLF